ncbi:MAG: DNA topoisomerase 3 [Bradymonadia bacterium]
MIRLFIAEKPSVARDIARAVGAKTQRKGYIEGNGVWVAWCIGHLVEPAAPDEHNPQWKRWDPSLLPMLPRRLHLKAQKRTKSHLDALCKLMNHRNVGEIINACDAGREGELIFRYVYEYARCDKPVQRFWVSSLTPGAIKAGLAALKPGSDYDALGAAARCRAEADWLVGMNATRGLTSRAGTLMSVGRVQTPTLAMVVHRELEIEAFTPEAYWEVYAQLEATRLKGADSAPERIGDWKAQWIGRVGEKRVEGSSSKAPPTGSAKGSKGKPPPKGRIWKKAEADQIVAELLEQQGEVVKVDQRKQEIRPPQFHHLTSLQQLANRRYGLTADQTLKAAQALYEKHKLITYPRTDARHITRSDAAGIPGVVKALAGVSGTGPLTTYAQDLLTAGWPALGRRYVDDSQVGDHPAILPTTVTPNPRALSRDELRVYDLVVRQFLGALSPPAIYARTTIEAHVNGHRLEAEGKVRLQAGFEAINPPPSKRKTGSASSAKASAKASGKGKGSKAGEPDDIILPAVQNGDACKTLEAHHDEKETRPPPRYTEASLLGSMERAGRSLEEAHLRAALRECGLGTPATRAAIIETLLRRHYMRRQGKVLVPEPAGRALVEAVPFEALKSPQLTAQWETQLKAIAEGREPPTPFRKDIRTFVSDLIGATLAAPPIKLPPEVIREGRRGRPPRPEGGRGKKGQRPQRAAAQRADSRRGQRHSTGRSTPNRGAPNHTAAMASAGMVPPPGQPMTSTKPAKKKARAAKPTGPIQCPSCQQGEIIKGQRGWGCDQWRQGCRFVVWFVHEGVEIPEAEAEKLFRNGRTAPFHRPEGARRRKSLILDPQAEHNVRWGR